MKIPFPKTHLSEQTVGPYYETIRQMHMHYAEIQSRELTNLKYAGIFLLATLGMVLLSVKGIVENYLLGTLFLGIGTLCVQTINILFITSGTDLKITCCEKEGKVIEDQYPTIVNCQYFQMLAATENLRYKASLYSKLLPFVLVGGLTILAGISLALKMSVSLALTVGLCAVPAFLVLSALLIRVINTHWTPTIR